MQYKYKFRTALMVFPNLISVCISIFVILFVVKSNLYMGKIIPTAFITFGFALATVLMVYSKSHMFFNRCHLAF